MCHFVYLLLCLFYIKPFTYFLISFHCFYCSIFLHLFLFHTLFYMLSTLGTVQYVRTGRLCEKQPFKWPSVKKSPSL